MPSVSLLLLEGTPLKEREGNSPEGKGSRDPLKGRKGGPTQRTTGKERRGIEDASRRGSWGASPLERGLWRLLRHVRAGGITQRESAFMGRGEGRKRGGRPARGLPVARGEAPPPR